MSGHFSVLLRFPFIVSLSILILNDHWLKQSYPSWLTGKLSDFSGLFVFCVFLSVMLAPHLNSNKALFYLHLFVAALFTVWKIVPIELFTHWVSVSAGIPMPSRIKDSTDLIALVSVIFSFFWLKQPLSVKMSNSNYYRAVPKFVVVSILIITGWSIMATPPPIYHYKVAPETSILSNFDFEKTLLRIEEILIENGFPVHGKEIYGKNRFILRFSWEADTSEVGEAKNVAFFGILKSTNSNVTSANFRCTLEVTKDMLSDRYMMEIRTSSNYHKFDKKKIRKALKEKIYDNLRNGLNKKT
ncbi:MAG TPA: hypothetical protein VHP63_02135 [candidate division Zixibacteria bacterium]|nr:hypothetical protein [candidate division Zixibacteria bacterium]